MAERPWEKDYRIPRSTYPTHYDLYLHPDVAGGGDAFSGRVVIHVDSADASRSHFVAHSKFLRVTSTAVEAAETGAAVAIDRAFEHEANEFWVVELRDPVPKGKYRIRMEFEGRLDNGILGFYKSVYEDADGAKRTIATSKFQPTYARRCFPCFDEPSFKSTYSVTLVKPSEDRYLALSNMPVSSSKKDAPSVGLTEVSFEKSVPMVTYLAVFVVCDFVHLEEATAKTKIPFRVYGTAAQKSRLRYALAAGRAIADYYSDYFGVEYPLPKLDMAAIPDYSSGATEHWGLITYRETNLTYDPEESSEVNKQRVALVIAHELAHQWFGNLMTVSWWNDLWLNEGFATYIEYKGIKSFEPDWDTDSMFLVGDLYRVFDLDATFASHPIVNNVHTPDQINAVFDVISYAKGASVIRMMEDFLGPDTFRAGLKNFLVKFSYKNAVTQDLLDELSAAASAAGQDVDVTRVMNTWTRQKGYPVLTVTRKEAGSDGSAAMYSVKQERFLADADADPKEDPDASEFGYRWEVPVTYMEEGKEKTRRQVWMRADGKDINIPLPKDCKFLKLNLGHRGYYRVNYPASDWSAVSAALSADPASCLPSPSDRTGLLADAFALAAAGRLDYSVAMDLTAYLADKERDLAPWQVAVDALAQLRRNLASTPASAPLRAFQLDLVARLKAELGWEDEGNTERKLLRSLILGVACDCGDESTLKEAKSRLSERMSGGPRLSPNLRGVIYQHGLKQSEGRETWDWMMARYREEGNAQEKLKLLRGLASAKDAALTKELMEEAKKEEVVRSQDYFTLLTFISMSGKEGRALVWDFVRREWTYLVDRFTLNDRLFARLISDLAQGFSDAERKAEMRAHFDKFPEAGAGEQARKIALETVENNIKFVERHALNIKDWLQKKGFK